MKKRLFSLALVLCFVLGLLPQVTPKVGAATTTDAFGISMNKQLTDTNLKNNPYGTDGWFSLFTKTELVESKTKAGGSRNQYVDRYSSDGNRSREGSFGLDGGYSLIATTAFDPYGNGRKEYIANLGYHKGNNELYLYITDTNGVVSNHVAVDNSKGFMDAVKPYHAASHMAITAGDYDGDGRDSIIIYAVNSLTLQEYQFSGGNVSHLRQVCHIGDIVGGDQLNWVMDDDNDNGSDELRATPSLQMTTNDTDKDGQDELALTANWNDLDDDSYNKQNANWQCSYAAVYDYNTNWGQTFKRVLEPNQNVSASGRLRFAGITVGNVQQGESTADYPEIIAAGFIDNAGGDGCSIDEGKFSLYMFRYNGSGYSVVMQDDRHNLSGFSSGGLYSSDKIQDPVAVTAFAAKGIAQAEMLFVEGETYRYDAASSKFIYDTRDSYFNSDDDGIDRFIISNGGVQQAIAGNFDGNMDGREQIMFTTVQKYKYGSGHFFKTWRYGYNQSNSFYSNSYGWAFYDDGETAVSLAAADVGKQDGTMAKIKSKSLDYTKPEVIAILEAPPYFSEVNEGDTGNGTTEYGKSTTSGSSQTSSTSVSASVMAGFEYEDGVTGSGGGFEATISNSWTDETTTSTEQSYEISYSNDTGQNAVILYRSPVTVYEYDVRSYTPGSANSNTMVIGIQGEPATNMITVEQYNQAAASFGMDQIKESSSGDSRLAVPGNPESYHSMLPVSKDPKHSWQAPGSTIAYSSTGTTSQSLSITNATEQSSTYEFAADFQAFGVAFGVKVGGGGGKGFGSGSTTMNSAGTTKTGAVSARPTDVQNIQNYDFNWRFATWTQTLNQEQVPVLGYLVNNVVAPPSPPQNLALSEHTSSSMKLTWESGERPANEFKVYRYNSTNPYNAYTLLGTVSGGAEESGTYSFHLNGLSPDTTYQYVVTAVSLAFGESVYSEVVTGTTLAQSGNSLTFQDPSDNSALENEVASFSVNVLNFGGYNKVNYQWQEKLSGKNWKIVEGANQSALSVIATPERANAMYRCIVFGTTSAGDSVPYYSSAASLTVGLANVKPALSITGYDTGSGTQAAPFAGLSNYTKELSSTQTMTYTVQATAPVTIDGTTVNALVYNVGTEQSPVYVGIAELISPDGSRSTHYYAVSKSGEAYTAGTELSYTTQASYTKGGQAYTWPVPNAGVFVEPLSLSIDGKTYHRYVAVKATFPVFTAPADANQAESLKGSMSAVTAVGASYITADEKTYYPYSEQMSTLPAPATLPTDAELMPLYHTSSSADTQTYLVGHNDTDYAYTPPAGSDSAITSKKSVFRWYEITATGSPASYTPAEITQSVQTTLSGASFATVTDPVFTVATTQKTEDVTTTSQQNVSGRAITLGIQTTKLGGANGTEQVAAGNADYTILMVNQTSGKSTTLEGRTNANGLSSTSWTAPSAGLYAITVSTGNNKGESLYYLAGGSSTKEHTLAVSQVADINETAITSATYGDILSLRTGETTITTDAEGKVSAVSSPITDGLSYSYSLNGGAETAIATPTSFSPSSSGIYQITAKKDAQILASTILSVSKKSITLRPSWEGVESGKAPATLSNISVQTNGLVPGDNLDHVFTLVCDLYKQDGSLDTSKTGAFSVALNYQSGPEAQNFLSKYAASLESSQILRRQDTYPVSYSAGENGTVEGRYGDTGTLFLTGTSIEIGQKLQFLATPKSGFIVDQWSVNGTTILPGDKTYQLSNNNNTLTISSFALGNLSAEALNVKVTFKSNSHTVSYSVTGGVGGTLSAETAEHNKVENGGNVAQGATVTFTATPDAGQIISKWTVGGQDYTWPDTSSLYREKTLTLSKISGNVTVSVSYEAQSIHRITTAVASEAGTDTAGVTVSAKNAATNTAISDLSAVPSGSAITFSVPTSDTTGVKEWQLDKGDGAGFQVIPGSGGSASVTVYNITGDWSIKAIITTAQSYTLTYQVKLGESVVSDQSIASLKATSHGAAIGASPASCSAYIPLDFSLTLNDNYRVVSWSGISANPNDNKKASIASLTANTTVTVLIEEKPVVDFESETDGNITVSAKQGENPLTDGQHVEKDSGSIVFTANPKTGFEAAAWTLNGAPVSPSVDSSGETDNTTYTVPGPIAANVTIDVTAKPIPKYALRLSVEQIDGLGDGKHGSIRTDVTRKTLSDYTAAIADTSTEVDGQFYRDSTLTIVTQPEAGYRVQSYTWTVNGVSGSGSTLPDLSSVQGDVSIAVRFIKTVVGVTFGPTDPAHTGGYLTSALAAGSIDALGNADTGINLAKDTTLALTAAPATGYEVQYWTQNGQPIAGTEGKTAYTYVSLGQGESVYLSPVFRQVLYTVTAGADQGSISIAPAPSQDKARGGTELTFTASPANGYIVSSWTVNGTTQDGQTGNTFVWTVPNGQLLSPAVTSYDIRAVMTRGSYQLNYSAGTGGTVTSADAASGSYLSSGTQVTLTASPSAGHHLSHWLIDGTKQLPSGNTLPLTVTKDTSVQAVFELDGITVQYSVSGRPGNITATVNGNPLASGGSVPYGADVLLTVHPGNANDVLESWSVGGNKVSQMTASADVPLQYTLTNVTSAQTVEAALAERPNYTVSASAQANGSVSVGSDADKDGSVTVSRNGSATITAVPNPYYSFSHWMINGTKNDTIGSTLTLTDIKQNYTVEAVFKEVVSFDVKFSITGQNPNQSSVAVKAGEQVIYPTTDKPVSVVGGSTLSFTAQPKQNLSGNPDMVAKWTVNGTEVTSANMASLGIVMADRLSNKLVLSKLEKAVSVTVEFTPYVGYTIPVKGDSYDISNVIRTPDDTSPASEIRKGGTVTFTVTPTQLASGENGYLSKLLMDGYDCLTGTGGSGNVTAVKNAKGSYTVTVANVQKNIQAEIIANKLVVQNDIQVPDSLKTNPELDTPEEIKTRLETKLTNHSNANRAFYDVALKYYNSGTGEWQTVSEHDFPTSGVDVVLPYPAGTDSKDDFTLIHMLTISGQAGTMEVVSFSKKADGLHFHVNSLSPFAIGWNKYVAPAIGGGGGGGGGSVSSYTVNATVTDGGSITPAGKVSVVSGQDQSFAIKPNAGYRIADVLVDDKSVGAVESYTFKAVSANHSIAVRFVRDDETNCPSKPYSDIDRSQWYHESVDYAISQGLMSGYDAHSFGPNDELSRAMLAQILYNHAKRPAVSGDRLFKDVAPGMWYTNAILWANAQGYVTGYGNELFGPDDSITREQLAAILWRHAGNPSAKQSLSDFSDAGQISSYASAAMTWAVEKGIVSGKGNGVLDPTGKATRAEVAAMLMRYLGLTQP